MEPQYRPRLPRLEQNNQTNRTLKRINDIIATKLQTNENLIRLNLLTYVGAITAIYHHSQKPLNPRHQARKKPKKPWESRLEQQVLKLRKEIGVITQLLRPNPSSRVKKISSKILRNYENDKNKSAVEILDLLKQTLAAKKHRLKRYRLSDLRRSQNQLFGKSEKLFYQSLDKKQEEERCAEHIYPADSEMKNFWENIWSQVETHKPRAAFIRDEKNKMRNLQQMCNHVVTEDEVASAIKRTSNWKATGVDQIHNFWYKKFKALHKPLALNFTEIVISQRNIPEFFTKGITYLIPKTNKPEPDPSKYRPITCLNTAYKIFTSILSAKINTHIDQNNILATEQKACRKMHQGCKEQLITDMIIIEEIKRRKGDIYTCYIDYQKAFDSIPHTWLIEILNIYKIDSQIILTLEKLMQNWKTSLTVANSKTLGEIKIKRGIFQGDALSALWFCLALNPLSTILNKAAEGYIFPNSRTKINHLLYMDDLKLYSTTRNGIEKLIRKSEAFSQDIKMKFGIDKCRINEMRKGKIVPAGESYMVHTPENVEQCCEITAMTEEEVYKYLGFQQSRGTEHKVCKELLTNKYKQRLNKILKSQLSGKNKFKAINTYATPVLTYSFGILKWTNTELESLNRVTRTSCTKHRVHHPKSALERFYLPRKLGGRGAIDIANLHNTQIRNLREYFHNRSENNEICITLVNNDNNLTPLNLSNTAQTIGIVQHSERIQRWMAKQIHAKYPSTLNQPEISQEESHSWLTSTNIFSETEGFVVAIQDGVIATRNYRKYILKDNQLETDVCRMCHSTSETIDHLISGCTTLAPVDYTARHDAVAKIVHLNLCAIYGLDTQNQPYYKYQPPSVIENDQIKIYWDRQIITDHPIPNNIPDILITDFRNKITIIIDIAIPHPSNINKKHNEKISKYTPLANEIKELWDQETVKIVPIIIGATGEIPKKLLEALRTLGIKPRKYIEMQKAVLLGTTAIVRKVIGSGSTI